MGYCQLLTFVPGFFLVESCLRKNDIIFEIQHQLRPQPRTGSVFPPPFHAAATSVTLEAMCITIVWTETEVSVMKSVAVFPNVESRCFSSGMSCRVI